MSSKKYPADFWTKQASEKAAKLVKKHWWWRDWEAVDPDEKDRVEFVAGEANLKLVLYDSGSTYVGELWHEGDKIASAWNSPDGSFHEADDVLEYLVAALRRQAGPELGTQMPTSEALAAHIAESVDMFYGYSPQAWSEEVFPAMVTAAKDWFAKHGRRLDGEGQWQVAVAHGLNKPETIAFERFHFGDGSISHGTRLYETTLHMYSDEVEAYALPLEINF